MVVLRTMRKGFVRKFYNPFSKKPKVTVSQEARTDGFTFRKNSLTGKKLKVVKRNPEKLARQMVSSGKYREVRFYD
jgi:hypothetical protein